MVGFAMGGQAEGRMQQRPGGPAMGGDMPEMEEESNVSPEEQEVYDQVVGNALKLISDPKTRSGILDTLKGDGNPREGLAMAAATVAKRVMDSASQNGVKVPGDVMLPAGQEIVEALAEVQANAGIADLSEDEIEGAFLRGLDLFREMATADGSLDAEPFKQDFAAMVEADKAGSLDQVVPGASEAAQRLPQGGQPAAGDEEMA